MCMQQWLWTSQRQRRRRQLPAALLHPPGHPRARVSAHPGPPVALDKKQGPGKTLAGAHMPALVVLRQRLQACLALSPVRAQGMMLVSPMSFWIFRVQGGGVCRMLSCHKALPQSSMHGSDAAGRRCWTPA